LFRALVSLELSDEFQKSAITFYGPIGHD
jgi:hypothetical protein